MLEQIYRKYITYNIPFTAKTLMEYYKNSRSRYLMPSFEIGFAEHEPVIPNDNTIKRIMAAHKTMKAGQEGLPDAYCIKGGWELQIKEFMGDLNKAIFSDDVDSVISVLSNLYRNSSSAWINGAADYKNNIQTKSYKYAYINMWLKHYLHYTQMRGHEPIVNIPTIGNPVGLYYNNKFIPDEAIRFQYSTDDILNLLDDIDYPTICEIGVGLGEQAYSVLSQTTKPVNYILTDIPEMITVVSYILMTAFPDKKILLYGEDNSWNYQDYDVVLWPNYMLRSLRDNSIDLFYNSCSFPEMDSGTVEEYLRVIHRACRRYFMHINISANVYWDENGNAHCGNNPKSKHNKPGSEIKPDNTVFKLIYQHPWLFQTPIVDMLYGDNGYVSYLYGKRR